MAGSELDTGADEESGEHAPHRRVDVARRIVHAADINTRSGGA